MTTACQECGEQAPARARFCPACGTSVTPGAATPETRRLVTVLFSDDTGSTALGERLDPESLGRVMGSWSDASAAASTSCRPRRSTLCGR